MATPPPLIDRYAPPPPQPAYTPAQAGAEARRARQLQRSTVNVGDTERIASGIGGGALALFGLTRGSLRGLVLAAAGGGLVWRAATGHCPVYGTLGVSTAPKVAGEAAGTQARTPGGALVERTATVNRPVNEVYRFWRDFENLPLFMNNLESVTTSDPRQSHWVAKGPLGMMLEWDARITEERDNELIAWRSLDDADVHHAGSVRFTPAPGGRGAEVTVQIEYSPPGGPVGATVAKLFGGDPDRQVREDLRRFKQIMEAGETPTTAGQPSGRGREGGDR